MPGKTVEEVRREIRDNLAALRRYAQILRWCGFAFLALALTFLYLGVVK